MSDAYFNNVSLLLHGNGANGSTTFTDSGPGGISPSSIGGTISISTANSKFGGASINALRTGELIYNTSGFAFGTNDFTIEGWLWWNTASGDQQYGPFQLSTAAGYATSGNSLGLYAALSSKWGLYLGGSSPVTTLTITTLEWHHFALVRASGVLTLYVNGTSQYSAAHTVNYTNTYGVIGGYYSTAYRFDGYIDDFRVTNGVARYTANFSVPTAAFENNGYSISGVIRDDTGALCARTVRAYDRSTGALLGSTTSDATTGAYSINTGAGEVQLVVLDDSGGTIYNDLVDRVIPA